MRSALVVVCVFLGVAGGLAACFPAASKCSPARPCDGGVDADPPADTVASESGLEIEVEVGSDLESEPESDLESEVEIESEVEVAECSVPEDCGRLAGTCRKLLCIHGTCATEPDEGAAGWRGGDVEFHRQDADLDEAHTLVEELWTAFPEARAIERELEEVAAEIERGATAPGSGAEGIDDTLALLDTKRKANPNLWWAGAGKTSQEALKPAVFTVPGKQLEVCFHAFGYAGSSLVAIPGTEESFAAVKRSASKCDVVIVSVHHGIEYRHVPPKPKAELYRRYIDAGADVLLGHHPHVIQGIETYKKGIIFHSLGNFSFASKTNRHHATGAKLYSMLPLIYIKDGRVERAEVLPLYVNNSEPWTLDGKTLHSIDFTPQILKGSFAQAVMTELREWTARIPGIARSAVEAYQIKGDRIRIQVRK